MKRSVWANKGWKFHLGEVANGSFKGLDDSGWQEVCLPHDWSVSQPFSRDCSSGTGYLPGGVGWYRLRFKLPKGAQGKRVLATFEGIYKNSRVWINSNYLGKRPYGYSTFSHDITQFLTEGDNVLAVRAEHIDLADSRWFTGAGMTRGVFFTYTDALHFVENGVFAYTVSAEEGRAKLGVDFELSRPARVEFTLLDAQGHMAASGSGEGQNGSVVLEVESPRLWSPDKPALYTLVARALENGEARDEVRITTGLRSLRFDAEQGFFLNGVNMKLKGICVHHDAGTLGAAVPQNVWERRLLKLKEAGVNALRTSHNPPDPGLLDLCDRLGLLVIDEAFDEWEGFKNKWWQGHNVYPPKHFGYADDFPVWHRADLIAMVRRDRNHPCVFQWSIGNEIDYPNDPYVHPLFDSMTGNNDANKPIAERVYDSNKPNADRLAVLARELVAIVREQDSTRSVSSGLAFPELSVRTGFFQALDVAGYNYKEHLYEAHHAEFPDTPILGSENSTRAEAWLPVRDLPYISGQFLWTGIDFLGEARGWPVRVSTAGLMDLAGFEKPLFAQRKALWAAEKTARLAVSEDGQVWHERFCWEGEPGEIKQVACYTNAPSAELFLNGESLGIRESGDLRAARWEVPFKAGELRAVARFADGGTLDNSLHTVEGPLRLELRAVESSLPADGYAVAQVEVCLRDSKGQTACGHDEEIAFGVESGSLLGIENGAPDDLTPYTSPRRRTREGRAIVYLRAGEQAGVMALTAQRGGETARLEIPLHRNEDWEDDDA